MCVWRMKKLIIGGRSAGERMKHIWMNRKLKLLVESIKTWFPDVVSIFIIQNSSFFLDLPNLLRNRMFIVRSTEMLNS